MIKRLFDVCVAVVALLLLCPLLMLVAIAIRLNLGSPVFFVQQRAGHHGRLFWIYKFRTMRSLYAVDGKPLPDSKRMSKLGSFLRKTSIDELPELWNVICGDMSLVGPRPLLPEYLARYNSRQQRRHDVRPGLTGWAQVNGRNAISWEERFEMDVRYVEQQSFCLDMKILFQTVGTVLSQSGVSADSHVTMPPFAGYEHMIETKEPGSPS